MLLIEGTNSTTGTEVDIYHEIKNEGKLTEEHHISVFTKGTGRSPAGKILAHYVISKDAAAELKAHL